MIESACTYGVRSRCSILLTSEKLSEGEHANSLRVAQASIVVSRGLPKAREHHEAPLSMCLPLIVRRAPLRCPLCSYFLYDRLGTSDLSSTSRPALTACDEAAAKSV